MKVIEVRTINGADIFLCQFPGVKGKKQFYASYILEGGIDKLQLHPVKRGWELGPLTPETLLHESLLSEHQARIRFRCMVEAAPYVHFVKSEKSIHFLKYKAL